MTGGKHQAEWLLLCIPWTENQETWIQSQVPLFASESSYRHLVPRPTMPKAEGRRWGGGGELLLDPYSLWEQRLPRNDREVDCVVRKRGDLLQALCKFSGGITRRPASWLGQFSPVALQDSQDSGQMAFAAKELSGYMSEGESAGSIP